MLNLPFHSFYTVELLLHVLREKKEMNDPGIYNVKLQICILWNATPIVLLCTEVHAPVKHYCAQRIDKWYICAPYKDAQVFACSHFEFLTYHLVWCISLLQWYGSTRNYISHSNCIICRLVDISEIRLKISLETAPTQRPRGVLGVWSPVLSAVGNAFKIQVT